MINPTGFIAIFVAVACAMALLLVGFMLLVNEKNYSKNVKKFVQNMEFQTMTLTKSLLKQMER